MNLRTVATAAAAGTLALLVLGGTALAVTSQTTTAGVTPTGVTDVTVPTFGTDDDSGTTTESSPPSTDSAPVPAGISVQLACELAVAEAGGGVVTRVEAEVEHGRPEWKVRVAASGVEHDIRIDAATGTVTRHDVSTGRVSAPTPTTTEDRAPRPTDDRVRAGDDDRGRHGGDDDRDDRSGRHGGDDRDDDRDDDNSGRGDD